MLSRPVLSREQLQMILLEKLKSKGSASIKAHEWVILSVLFLSAIVISSVFGFRHGWDTYIVASAAQENVLMDSLILGVYVLLVLFSVIGLYNYASNARKTSPSEESDIFTLGVLINRDLHNARWQEQLEEGLDRNLDQGALLLWIGKTSVVLGLGGTFLGLVSSVGGVSRSLSLLGDDKQQQFLTSMLSGLGNLDQAFLTSIAGISTSLAVGFLHQIHQRQAKELFSSRFRLISLHIANREKDQPSAQQIAEAYHQQLLGKAEDQLLVAQKTTSLLQELKDESQQRRKQLELLLVEQIQRPAQQLAQASTAARESLTTMAQAVESASSWVSSAAEHLDTLNTRNEERSKNLAEHLLKGEIRRQEQLQIFLEKLDMRDKTLREKLTAAQEKEVQHVAANSITLQAQLTEAASQGVQSLRDWAERQARDAAQREEEAHKRLEQAGTEQRKELAEFFSNLLEGQLSKLSAESDRLSKAHLDAIDTIANKNNQKAAEWLQAQHQGHLSWERSLEESTARYRKLSTEVTETMEQLLLNMKSFMLESVPLQRNELLDSYRCLNEQLNQQRELVAFFSESFKMMPLLPERLDTTLQQLHRNLQVQTDQLRHLDDVFEKAMLRLPMTQGPSTEGA